MVEKLDTLFIGDVVSAWHVHEGYPNQRQHCVVKINNQNKLMNYKIHLLYMIKGHQHAYKWWGLNVWNLWHTLVSYKNVLYDFRNRLSNQGHIRNLKLKRAPVLGKGSEQPWLGPRGWFLIIFLNVCKYKTFKITVNYTPVMQKYKKHIFLLFFLRMAVNFLAVRSTPIMALTKKKKIKSLPS